jgi:hypothetical protein
MSLTSFTVGANQVLAVVEGDPSNASAAASTIVLADAENLTSLYARLCQSVGMLLNQSGTYDRQRSAIGTTGIPAVSTESTKATYSACSLDVTPAATATDFFSLVGSSSKVVRLLYVQISGIATAAASRDIQLVKRSTANSGGTLTNPTPCQHDSNDAAVSATVQLYSANPTLGSSAGVARAAVLNLGAAGGAGVITWDFTNRNDKALVLRGVAQSLNLNFVGQAVPSGTSIDVSITWTEE